MDSPERSPHSVRDTAQGIEESLLDAAAGWIGTPSYIAKRDRARNSIDSLWRLIEQYEALREERDRLRVMLDAILPEKTTFHIIEGEMPGHHIPISPDEYPASEPEGA